jgi:hypothetical protein
MSIGSKMAGDVNEDIENALIIIVTTTGSSGNKKKELKTTLFDTVSILRKLLVKLIDTNESNARKITYLERQVANTNAVLGEVKGRKNNMAEPSSTPARVTHRPTEEVTPPGGGKVKLYSEAVEWKTKQKRYKLTVTSKDNQTANKIKEMLISNINPNEIKV